MASIQSLDFTSLVQNMVTSAQARATVALNLTIGSVLRAILESVAAVVLWLEAQIAYVLTITRLATSNGPDVDSFVNDFGFERIAAVAATGQLTFGRFSSTAQAVVPINAPVQSADGTQNFFVTLDASNPNYSASLGGYVLGTGISSINVPSQAVTPGSAGNMLANTITVITSPITGVDTVTNAAAFTNGLDAESDPAVKARFVLFINSLSKAIQTAIAFAIASSRQGLFFTLTENYAYNGAWQPGFFYAVVDDGTGTPSDATLNAAGAAIEAVRGFTIQYGVFAPIVLNANVSMTIVSATGYVHNTVAANVSLALTNFINSLMLGTSLPYTQLAAIAYGVPGVQNVTDVVLNSSMADLTATPTNVIKAGDVVVS
ncbi:MAG: baseplate J/gp47 family protein [Acidobacteriaceae bacterium]